MVKITTDSTSDLGHLFDENDIAVMPLIVSLDGKSYHDGVDITPQDIFKTYEQKKVLPKTAARSIEDYKDFFIAQKREGASEILHVSLSSELSSSYNNACLAATEFENVTVVDSRSLSTGSGLLALKAVDLKNSGVAAGEIAEQLNMLVPHVEASFVVDTMEYLHKGGRCSGLARFVAGILKIKPMLILKSGKIEVGQKFSGSMIKSVEKYVDAILRQYNTPDYSRIFVTHSYADKALVDTVCDMIKRIAPDFKNIITTKAGCTVTSHCGKGTLGILYINKV